MQKDFMSMAQQPQQAKAAEPEISNETMFSDLGMPTENTPEAAKKRLMMVLEELGVTQNLRPDQLQQLAKLVDEYVALAQKGDLEALEKHPISQLLNQAQAEFQQMQGGQQGSSVPGQPQDFASMMPPTPGGGMSGR